MTDYADLQKRLRSVPSLSRTQAADAIAALVAEQDRLQAENAALQAKLKQVRQECVGKFEFFMEPCGGQNCANCFASELFAILDEPNDVAAAGASVSVSTDARAGDLSPAEAAIKPGPSSAEPTGEQVERTILVAHLRSLSKWLERKGLEKVGLCAKAADEIEALSTAPQAQPSEATDAMVEAARVYVVELADAFAQWKDRDVDNVLRKMLRAALKAGSL